MSDKNRPKNTFYQNGIKLLVNKFFKEFENKDSEFYLLHEGFERTFEVWSKKYISSASMKDDVWHLIVKKLAEKHG